MTKETYWKHKTDPHRVYTFLPSYDSEDYIEISKAEYQRLLAESDARFLRGIFPEGSTIYTVLQSVSRSGMSRHIKVLVALPPADRNRARILDVSHEAARVLGWRVAKTGGVVVSGCGMDMGFHLVYTLSSRLHGDGYACKHEWV